MKATLQNDGFILIQPESIAESFAMQHILPKMDGDSCGNCGRQDSPVIFDTKPTEKINSKTATLKDIATEFYYWWHNQPGTNTAEGFDDWWEINKARFDG